MDWVPELSGSLEGKNKINAKRNIKGSALFNEASLDRREEEKESKITTLKLHFSALV